MADLFPLNLPTFRAAGPLAALVLSLAATSAAAEPDRVSVLLRSWHIDPQAEFQEFNPGIFLTWDRVTVGAYRNSYDNLSASVTYDLPLWERGDTVVSVFAGASYYGEDAKHFAIDLGGGLVPIGGLQVIHGNVFMQVIPSDGIYTDAVVTFGLTW